MTEGNEDKQGRSETLLMPALAVFLVSMAVIGLELVLMRCLSIASWHHFSYLVISTALLAFGASGTLLTLIGKKLERRFGLWAGVFSVAFAFSIPIAFRSAQALPLNFQYAFYSLHQAGLALAYHLIIFVPFLLGALVIGAALMHFSSDVHLVYGANLGGSGIGGVCIIILMYALPATHLLYAVSIMALLSGFCWITWAARGVECRISAGRATVIVGLTLLMTVIMAYFESRDDLQLRIDEYKTLARLRRWSDRGQATRRFSRHSPYGRVDAYDSPRFHDTLFAGFTAPGPPPPQSKLLLNGSSTGTIYRIESAQEAAILDHTPMSLAYRITDQPRTLLLGETGGTNIWLARRWQASHITAVQTNPQIVELMRGQLADVSGNVFALPGVEAVPEAPRLFLERTEDNYDVIQITGVQGMAAGTSGMQGMQENYLLTIEGFTLALRRLRPGGVLSITRSTQSPPRDNLKFIFTAVEALRRRGVDNAARHVAIFHNYLSVTTLVSPTPFSSDRCNNLRQISQDLRLDIDWSPGGSLTPSNKIAEIPGPEDGKLSWYHHAASRIFSGNGDQFLRRWIYNIRPATDDSPYFYNFFRWKSVPVLRRTYGRAWFRKAEMGYLIVLATLAEIVVIGAIFILLPLLWLRREGKQLADPVKRRFPTAVYFLLLGITFMMVEMGLIIRFTHFLGDPILSAGGVLSAFLVFTGLGSSLSRSIFRRPTRAICVAALGIGIVGASYEFVLPVLFATGASWPLWLRFAAAVLLAAPLAFLMGWPFPNGLTRVQAGSPPLVPWAWSANGFASVAGTPVAVLLAASFGFNTVMLVGIVLYGLAAVISWKLPQAPENIDEHSADAAVGHDS